MAWPLRGAMFPFVGQLRGRKKYCPKGIGTMQTMEYFGEQAVVLPASLP